MKTEFTTFRVTQGKEALAREWINTLKERKSECIETLGREKMLYESLFSYQEEGRMFLSWFSVQKEGHEDVESPEHEIDNLHLKYWKECIDKTFTPRDHEHLVTFIPHEVNELIEKLY